MADQVRQRTVTVTAGTLKAAPAETNISVPPAAVQKLEIIIPAGHAGLTGIQLAHAHQPIIPYDVGEYIVSDAEKIEWFMEDQPDSGNWQAVCYNTDVFDHVFYVRFLLVVVTRVPVVINGPEPFVAPAIPDDVSDVPYVVQPLPPDETPSALPPADDTPADVPPDEPVPDLPPDDTVPPDDIAPDVTSPDDTAPTIGEPAGPTTVPATAPASPAHVPSPTPSLPFEPNPHAGGYFVTLQGLFPNGDVSEWHHYTSGNREGDLVEVRRLGNVGRGVKPPALDGWYRPAKVLHTASYERVVGAPTQYV